MNLKNYQRQTLETLEKFLAVEYNLIEIENAP